MTRPYKDKADAPRLSVLALAQSLEEFFCRLRTIPVRNSAAIAKEDEVDGKRMKLSCSISGASQISFNDKYSTRTVVFDYLHFPGKKVPRPERDKALYILALAVDVFP
jgi:hypothetical protein